MAVRQLVVLALAAMVGVVACDEAPFGEVLVVVDTDVTVPYFAGRLRIDLFRADGTWAETRDVAAPDRGDWPLSFSLRSDEKVDKVVRLRLRAYPEGRTRDYRGESFLPPRPPFAPPFVADSLAALCANAPLLPRGQPMTLRRGHLPITAPVADAVCTADAATGSVAARVVIPKDGSYRFEVIGFDPLDDPGGTTLLLRRACTDPASQVRCEGGDNGFARFKITLAQGEYFLMSSGLHPAPADLTLQWDETDKFTLPVATPPPTIPDTPRLLVDGVDVTPATEPRPLVAIDRLVDVRVRPGQRRTAHLLLAGECLGTMADLAGGRSCVDSAGALAPVGEAVTVAGIDRAAGRSVAGSWAGERQRPCTATPRAPGMASGGPLFDEEVCVPGGAFMMGDGKDLEVAPEFAEQVAIVEPFLMDVHEVTVGRYRAALRQGFRPSIDHGPINDGPLVRLDFPFGLCTWNGTSDGPAPLIGPDRERHPLNCVDWHAARELCQFLGGDLPTAAQWEYAAAAPPTWECAAKPTFAAFCADRIYAAGSEPPSCQEAVHGHSTRFMNTCLDQAIATVAVDAEPWATKDRSRDGVRGLTGNAAEWILDSGRGASDPCWRVSPLRDVGCFEAEAPRRGVRGGSWASRREELPSARRDSATTYPTEPYIGFRCVRRGTAP